MAVNDPSKFRQIYNQEDKVLVEADYDNIILIDPNKVQTSSGEIKDRFIQQENLVMYANLETKIIPRTKLAIGDNFDNPVNNTSIASLSSGDEDLQINFLKPKGKTAFDTSWSDDFTGRGTRQGKGINQNAEYTTTNDGNLKFNRKILNYEDTQTLGIKDIRVKISSIGIPTVDMTLVDVRGRTLFEQGENSVYSVFFNLPYPTFYLTLKGWYGKAIRYQLTLLSFNAKFDSGQGNFEISLKLMGRNSAILADSILSFGKNSPKMFTTKVTTQKNKTNNNNTGNDKTELKVENDTVGLQKLREVYSIYESKGLIPKNFPRITLESFIKRATDYESGVQEKIKNGDFNVVNDVNDYQNTLINIEKSIYINSIQDFLDTTERLVINGSIHYPFKEGLSFENREETKKNLKANLDANIDLLVKNNSFGKNKKYKLPGKKNEQPGEIAITIKYQDLEKTVDYNSISNDEFRQSYELNIGTTPNDTELKKYITDFKTFNNPTQKILDSNGNEIQSTPTYFSFGEIPNLVNEYTANSFLFKLQKMKKNVDDKSKEVEQALTDELANMIVDSKDGLGFEPTIRNVFAVLFAGLDAFYKMLDDVHTNAWTQRKNPARLNAILSPKNNVGVDSLDLVNGSFALNNENTVYPWPQYYEKESQQDGSDLYVIKYPGDSNSLSTTKGYNYSIWPEIAFTEEFITAALQKNTPTEPQSGNNLKTDTNYMSVSAVEFPLNNQPYGTKTEVSFLYELFERSYLSTHYANINRGDYKKNQIDKVVSNIDAENIVLSLKDNPNPTLTNILKNFKLGYTTYLEYLKKISNNGTGTNWTLLKNSDYVTEYIKNYFLNSYNKVYSIDSIDGISIAVGGNIPLVEKLKDYINSTNSSKEYFLDTYPFTDLTWLKNNLQDGQSLTTIEDFYKTQTYIYLDEKKTLARLNETESKSNINVFVNKYGFQNYTQQYVTSISTNTPVNSRDTLSSFYNNRLQKDQYFTESFIDYGNEYSGNVNSKIQTTSLLNTPYFINAILKGVELSKNQNNKNPYVGLGYLYLNSLPLLTTREKIKQTENGQDPVDLDYLSSTLNKFSSLHRLPYSWVLKYGAIWHRYKTFINDNVDILDGIWKDFDYLTNYDPINSATTTSYSGSWVGNIVLQSSTVIPNTNNNNDIVSTGFYPKVINDIFRYFYDKDLSILQNPSVNNFISETTNNGLKVVSSFNKFFAPGFDISNLNRQLTIKNYQQYFEKPNGDNDNILLVPSMGGLKINQSVFECFNNLDKIKEEVFNNKSVYNGSVRSLWGSSNFGYYNNSLIRKPNYNEYLKTIDTQNGKKQNAFDLKNNNATYSNIEEIFSLFEPKILDEFETYFLNFCKPNPIASDLILVSEQTNATPSAPGQVKNVKQKRLFEQIKSLFLIPKNSVTLTSDDVQNGISLAEAQTKNFMANVVEFLNFDCILKMGNPSNFDRKSFNYFTDNVNFKPTNITEPTKYVPNSSGSLPGDGTLTGPSALITSIANKEPEWDTLRLYVGEFTQNDIRYTNTGSTITDFFIDNNIEFSITNIQGLYPLIRLYAKEKLKDPTYNSVKFVSDINSYITEQKNFNEDTLNETVRYLNSNLDDVKVTTNKINSTTSGNVVKLDQYTLLKGVNDKWIAGSDFTNRTIFEDFLFFDKANRDIGNKFTINIDSLPSLLEDSNKSYLQLISAILEKNRFLFFAMPAYVNFYGLQEAALKGEPIPTEIPGSMFGTYLDVDYMDSKPKFLCVYVGKPSEHLGGETSFKRYRDDAFDMRKYDNPLRTSYNSDTDFSKNNKVVAFAVDYGIQNQSFFKSVSLDMSEKKNTAESNRLITELGNQGAGNSVAQQTVSLYSIYKTRSYTTTVDTMGNAMIQPTMYFNLRHVPLFYGPYWIMEVNHSISAGKFDTSFKGVRMPLYNLPDPNSLLDSVNKDYLTYYKDLIIKNKKITENPVISNNTADKNVGTVEGDQSTCKKTTKYPDLPFVDISIKQTTESELKDRINAYNIDGELKPLYYGIVKTKPLNITNSTIISTPNYNLYNIPGTTLYNGAKMTVVKAQFCGTADQKNQGQPYPWFTFNSIDESLLFYNESVNTFLPIIKKLRDNSTQTDNSKKYAEAYTIFTLFWDQARYVKPGGAVGYYPESPKTYEDFKTRFDEKVKPENTNLYETYNLYMTIFENAYKTFFP
jgi:hypothetical protein